MAKKKPSGAGGAVFVLLLPFKKIFNDFSQLL